MEHALSDELVTVAIPAFNCASTIATAVQSCLDQTYAHFEVIVVNDGSTDATPDVLRTFGRRIRVINQSNLGLAAARNAGHRAASGEYIAWMDGDDLARPDRLKVQIAALRAVPEAALVCSDFSAFDGSDGDFNPSYVGVYYGALQRLGGVETVFPNELRIAVDGAEARPKVRWGNVYDALLAGNFVHPPTVLMRRRLLQRVGEFDASLQFSSDYDLLLRASRFAPFAYVELPLLRYRCHEGQMSHAARSGKLQLETVRILEKAASEDLELEARRGGDLRRFSAEALLSAARALARTDRLEALRLLRAAQSYWILPSRSLAVLARIAAPNAAVDAAKRLRRILTGAAAGLLCCNRGELEWLAELIQLAAYGISS
jgi:glycosyltransferase involved in cell wall biosynthesis